MTNNLKKKFKVWEREDGIVVGKFWGEQDEKDAKEFVRKIYKLTGSTDEEINTLIDKFGIAERLDRKESIEKIPLTKKKINILIDASEGGKSTANARKIYAEFAKVFKTGKVAIFGLSTLIKVVATFIIRAAGKGNVKFFLTEAEALKWLKEEKI